MLVNDHDGASLGRLIHDLPPYLTLADFGNRLAQAAVLQHAFDVQVLRSDGEEAPRQGRGQLVLLIRLCAGQNIGETENLSI